MPVTFKVADHPSQTWGKRKVTSREDLFSQTCKTEARQSRWIIQSSISPSTFEDSHISPSDNGFVYTVWQSYNTHQHLTIRPDDIWFAILSQLSFYINAHAEELRTHFVAHEGQKQLKVKAFGTIHSVDFGALARQMTGLIQENVKDPDLRDWIMPAFSTTKVDDRTTAAVLMMGSMQAYFGFTMVCMCGHPSVTLLGEREDYEDILHRLDKLEDLGPETQDWASLLRPILRGMIASFEDVMTAETKDFWAKICHYEYMGSGPEYVSGWITAFCYWSNNGTSLYYCTPPKFDAKYVPNTDDNIRMAELEVDGVKYHSVDTGKIPTGFASVPVTVDDNGKEYKTKMVAGSVGISAAKSGEKGEDGEEKLDSVRSVSGWIMYELKSEEEMKEMKRLEEEEKKKWGRFR
jgi:hypothetical protein